MIDPKANLIQNESFELEETNTFGNEMFPSVSGAMTGVEQQLLGNQLFNVFPGVQAVTNIEPAGLEGLAGFAAGGPEAPMKGDITNLAMGIVRTLLGAFTGDFATAFMELANFVMEKAEGSAIINSLNSRGITPSYFLPV